MNKPSHELYNKTKRENRMVKWTKTTKVNSLHGSKDFITIFNYVIENKITNIDNLKSRIIMMTTQFNVSYHYMMEKNTLSTSMKCWCYNDSCPYRIKIIIFNDSQKSTKVVYKYNTHDAESDFSYFLSYGKHIRNNTNDILVETRTEWLTPYIGKDEEEILKTNNNMINKRNISYYNKKLSLNECNGNVIEICEQIKSKNPLFHFEYKENDTSITSIQIIFPQVHVMNYMIPILYIDGCHHHDIELQMLNITMLDQMNKEHLIGMNICQSESVENYINLLSLLKQKMIQFNFNTVNFSFMSDRGK